MKKISLPKVSIIVILIVFSIVIGSIFISFDQKSVSKRQTKYIEKSIISAIALCYALEGKYPDDIYYMRDNYGIQLDEQRYIYHYEKFASNIMPSLRVFVKPTGGK